MKVIKEENAHNEKPKTITCHKCKSKLQYVSADVKLDRDGKYIECPICKQFIAV